VPSPPFRGTRQSRANDSNPRKVTLQRVGYILTDGGGVSLTQTTSHLAGAREEDAIMRVMPWLLVSVLATSFAAGANAQDIDSRKVDAAFDRKPAALGDVHRLAQDRAGAERRSRLSQFCLPPEETPDTVRLYCRTWRG
jgi:hypothetical protein